MPYRNLGLLAVLLTAGVTHAAPFSDDPRFQQARGYADTMIDQGRDHYGPLASPAFVSTIDLRTMSMPLEATEATTRLYADFFRADDCATSANPMYHIDLYQLLFALSDLTGNPKYREAGEAAIAWFFDHAQSPKTGLLAWGEHMGWNLIQDTWTVGGVRQNGQFQRSDTHEFYGPWLHWDVTWRVAPEASRTFALGLWEHQIYDHETCEFSRHARYSGHGPEKGHEFARQIGFYLDTWSAAYVHSGDPRLLLAVRKMAHAVDGWRSPGSRLIPLEGKSPQVAFVLHNLSFMVDGWRASQRLPEPERQALQALIGSLDQTILGLSQDLSAEGEGFAKIVDSRTGAVSNAAMEEARPQTTREQIDQRYSPWGGLWASAYGAGSYTDARHALLCFRRWRQSPRKGYRELVVQTADRYLGQMPDVSHQPLTPKTVAPVMGLLHGAYRITNDSKYLEKSEALAGLARRNLFHQGIPLPHATQHKEEYPYYASISYGDSLMLMFCELSLLRCGLQADVERIDLGCSIR